MKVKIGEVLVAQGLVTSDQVDKALSYQKSHGGKLGSVMVELGFVSDQNLALALSKQLHLPAAKMDDFRDIPLTALDCMNSDTVRKHGCIPLLMRERLLIAISDPWEIKAINEWAVHERKQVQLVIAPEIWITAAMERYYKIARADRFKGVSQVNPLSDEEELEIIDLEEEVSTPEFSFTSFQQTLSNCQSIEAVFDTLMANLTPFLPQMAIYVARKGAYAGWVLQGFPARPADFSKIQVNPTLDTPIRTLVQGKKPHHGSVPGNVERVLGFELLQIQSGQALRFYPIVFRNQVTTILMGISPQPLSELDELQVCQACQKVESALEMLVYRNLILAPTST